MNRFCNILGVTLVFVLCFSCFISFADDRKDETEQQKRPPEIQFDARSGAVQTADSINTKGAILNPNSPKPIPFNVTEYSATRSLKISYPDQKKSCEKEQLDCFNEVAIKGPNAIWASLIDECIESLPGEKCKGVHICDYDGEEKPKDFQHPTLAYLITHQTPWPYSFPERIKCKKEMFVYSDGLSGFNHLLETPPLTCSTKMKPLNTPKGEAYITFKYDKAHKANMMACVPTYAKPTPGEYYDLTDLKEFSGFFSVVTGHELLDKRKAYETSINEPIDEKIFSETKEAISSDAPACMMSIPQKKTGVPWADGPILGLNNPLSIAGLNKPDASKKYPPGYDVFTFKDENGISYLIALDEMELTLADKAKKEVFCSVSIFIKVM